MSEQDERTRTSDADQSRDKIEDPQVGLDRLRNVLKRILSVRKQDLTRREDTLHR